MIKKLCPLLIFVIILCSILPQVSAQSPSHPVINAGNVSRLSPIRTIGYGQSTDVAFSPDGEYFAVGTMNGIMLYSVDDFSAEPRFFEGEAGEVAISPDSRTVASGGHVWDIATGDLLFQFEGYSPAFTSSGDRLITASEQDIVVLDAKSGDELARMPTGTDIHEMRLSVDDVTLATRDMRNTFLWSLETGEPGIVLAPAEVPDFMQSEMVFSPDGTLLLSVGWNGYAMWDVTTGEVIRSQFLLDNPEVNSAAFSPDGRQVVLGDGNGFVAIYEATTGEGLGYFCSGSMVFNVVFNPDGTLLAAVLVNGDVHIWDMNTHDEYTTLTGYGYDADVIGFNATDTVLSAASMNGAAWQFDPLTGKQISTVQAYSFYVGHGTNPYPTVVKMNQDGSLLGTGSIKEGLVRVWTPEGEMLGELEASRGEDVVDVAFAADGSVAAAITVEMSNAYIYVWSLDSGARLAKTTIPTRAVSGLAFNPEGNLLAIGKGTALVILQEWATGRIVAEFQGAEGSVTDFAFSPDGSILAFSGYCKYSDSCDGDNRDYVIRLGDTRTGELLYELEGHTGSVKQLAFSPDGSVLASTGGGELRFWNPATGEALATLETTVLAIAFSHDGTLLATYNGDDTISLWAVAE